MPIPITGRLQTNAAVSVFSKNKKILNKQEIVNMYEEQSIQTRNPEQDYDMMARKLKIINKKRAASKATPAELKLTKDISDLLKMKPLSFRLSRQIQAGDVSTLSAIVSAKKSGLIAAAYT